MKAEFNKLTLKGKIAALIVFVIVPTTIVVSCLTFAITIGANALIAGY